MSVQIHYWSPDVDRQLAYYVGVLAFDLVYKQPEAEPTNFCILRLEGVQVLIGASPEGQVSPDRTDHDLLDLIVPRVGQPGPVSVYIGISGIDEFYAQVAARGAVIVEPIWDAPWGTRQFSVVDPDANLTTFFAEE